MIKDKEHNMKENLLIQGVAKLKKFGFVNVNKTNILRDEVYSLYFSKMLQETLGHDLKSDEAINQLLQSMNTLIK